MRVPVSLVHLVFTVCAIRETVIALPIDDNLGPRHNQRLAVSQVPMYSAWVAPVGAKLSCVGAMCHPLSYTRPKTELAEEQRNLQHMLSGMDELPSEYMDPGRRLHEELEERSLRNHIPSRSRSPCRNFFWKTFSTC